MKCRLKNCFYEDKEIPEGEEVSEGKMYYHKKCYETKCCIAEIVKIFSEKINKDVVYAQLYRVINNIVFDKNLRADYLLFGLNYYVEHKIPLNYPQGLYYVIQNKEVLAEYNRIKNSKAIKKIDIDDDMNLDSSFEYKLQKKKTIGDLFDE